MPALMYDAQGDRTHRHGGADQRLWQSSREHGCEGAQYRACGVRRRPARRLDALANDAHELGRSQLYPSGNVRWVCLERSCRQVCTCGTNIERTVVRNAADRRRNGCGQQNGAQDHVMIAWLLVGMIVASTAAADVLQSLEMRRHP